MGRARSVGVTVFSILIIIGSLLSLVSLPGSLSIQPLAINILYIIITGVSIVCAIGLIMLKEWARKAIMLISLIVAVETVITTPTLISKLHQTYQFDKQMDERLGTDYTKMVEYAEQRKGAKLTDAEIQNIKDNYPKIKETAKKVATNVFNGIFIFMASLSILFNILVIFFFTRPKVKEQFAPTVPAAK